MYWIGNMDNITTEKDNLVSVIMPSYNSAATIRASIESVQRQTYTNWELLITDDCSTDLTADIVKEIAATDSRIKLFVNARNEGAGVSRNNSIAESIGRYIAFLDSDDLWDYSKLLKQVCFMQENNIALSYTCYQKISNDNILGKIIIPPAMITYHELLKSNVIGCLTAMYDVSAVGKVYMPTIRKRQDMALWLKILAKIDRACCINDVLAYYREGHTSLSSNKMKILVSQWQFYREYLGFNILKSCYYFYFYSLRALLKHKA
jgi:glycosyltransferase involved in cell wall biosynthesis